MHQAQWSPERPLPPPVPLASHAHMYYILLESLEVRTRLIDYLKENNVYPVFHYVPLHNSPMGIKLSGGKPAVLPVTEDIADRLLRLPCYYELEDEQVNFICQLIERFFGV